MLIVFQNEENVGWLYATYYCGFHSNIKFLPSANNKKRHKRG